QYLAQLIHIAVAGRLEERFSELTTTFPGNPKARALRVDMSTSAARELATIRRFAADGLRDLIEADAKNIVEQKRGPFQRSQTFESKHQRQRDVDHVVLRRIHNRVR